jgi:hypothetical protein
MSKVQHDVEVILQAQNPICWIASCAMVKGFGTQTSIGIGEFTGGFDPASSSIANLAGNWKKCTDLMETWGFNVVEVSELSGGLASGEDLATALNENGPAVLLHLCANFPYGKQYGDTSALGGAHAVVLTGVDTDSGEAYFNNPWGDKDQLANIDVILEHIHSDAKLGKTLGFWPA